MTHYLQALYLDLEVKDLGIEHVAVDSRLCQKNSLFVALKGEKVDGHDFLKAASLNGAVAAIVSSDYKGDSYGLKLIYRTDPLKALQTLAKEHLKQSKATIIGITGSVGKTTIKEMIAHLLSSKYKVAKTQGSMNGQIGLPLTILNHLRDHDAFVLEMGMSYKNEMDILIDIAPCHLAVVGKVAPVHYEHFNSLEEIAVEKAKLLDSSRLTQGFVYPGNFRFKAFSKDNPKVQKIDLTWEQEKPFSEDHLMENFLIAFQVARYLSVEEKHLRELATTFQGAPHRFTIKHLPQADVCIIDDSYNSNPMALKAVLQAARKKAGDARLVAVLGEMKELGALSKQAHQEIGMMCSYLVDELFCFGEQTGDVIETFKISSKPCAHFLEKHKLAQLLETRLQKKDVVLIKGSNSNRMWEVMDFLKID
jgi:UDP-N-acetylmuramoyl-tripeptide--D-alanyl-D-alanine ligase